MSTPGSPAARRCRDRSRSHLRHDPGDPRPRGRRWRRTMDITGGQSSHAVSAFAVTGTIGAREPAYPALPPGWKSIGQPSTCQLPSAASAPSFLGGDGGGAAPDVASLELLGGSRSAAPVSVPGLRPATHWIIGPSTHPLTHPEPERWTGWPPPLIVLRDNPVRRTFGLPLLTDARSAKTRAVHERGRPPSVA